MSNLNRITLIGNVGTDVEHIDFESGARLSKFTLGVNRYDKKNKKDITDWFKVESFSKLADYLKKGNRVCVDGSMETNVWQDKDGNNRKDYIVRGRTLEILTPKDKTQSQPTDAPAEENPYDIPDELPDIDEGEIPY